MHNTITAEVAARIACDLNTRKPASDSGDLLECWRHQYAQTPTVTRSICEHCAAPKADLGGYSLWLELVENCTRSCFYCYNPWRFSGLHRHHLVRLTPSMVSETVLRISRILPLTTVVLSGGEPFLYPGLAAVVQAIADMGIEIGIITNGDLIGRPQLAEIVSAGLTELHVSIHEHSASDRHPWVVTQQHAAFSLALALEYRIPVVASTVITSSAGRHLFDILRITRNLGVGKVILNALHSPRQDRHRTVPSAAAFSPKEFDALVAKAQLVMGDVCQVTVGAPPVGRRPTNDGVQRIVMSPLGDLKLCSQSSRPLANVVDDSSGSCDDFLRAIAAGRLSGYFDQVDACSCMPLIRRTDSFSPE